MEESRIKSIHPRHLARKMAKAQLDRRGATGYNKPNRGLNGKSGRKSPSAFAQHWKAFAVEASQIRKKGRK